MTRITIASFLIATPALAHTSSAGHIHAWEAGLLIALIASAIVTPRVLKAVRAKSRGF
ncbi:MAG: hypothetical protein AAGJ34_02665 [Pseudomonadota bacterium]